MCCGQGGFECSDIRGAKGSLTVISLVKEAAEMWDQACAWGVGRSTVTVLPAAGDGRLY